MPRLAQDAHPVLMGDFAQRSVIVTAVGQGCYKLRQARHVTDDLRNPGAIEVGAKADAVDAEALHQVIDVAYHSVQRGIRVVITILAQHTDAKVQPNHAIRLFDRVQLLIGQVASYWTNSMHI